MAFKISGFGAVHTDKNTTSKSETYQQAIAPRKSLMQIHSPPVRAWR